MAASVYSVAQINNYIKNMFEQDYLLGRISVRGEISNLKYHTSGHIYFTLKEKDSLLACVMFARQRGGLSFRLSDGQKVVVSGSINVYERDGKYQLYAASIEDEGEGRLHIEFEKLKNKLLEMGMFDQSFKQPIPAFAKTIGIVTAPTGAAVRDIINISKRRNPYIRLILYPAIVQGEQAAESIITGLRVLEKRGVDVIIIGRGGGSIEDLWAFNEESVARAVFDCQIPVISAVGHETDITIADYVADLRAPTPSAAAELAVFDIMSVIQKLNNTEISLKRLINNKLNQSRWNLEHFEESLKAGSPVNKLKEKRNTLNQISKSLNNCMDAKIRNNRMLLINNEEKMNYLFEGLLQMKRNRILSYSKILTNLSPSEKLASGYGFITAKDGRKISKIEQVEIGDTVKIRLSDGELDTVLKGKKQL